MRGTVPVQTPSPSNPPLLCILFSLPRRAIPASHGSISNREKPGARPRQTVRPTSMTERSQVRSGSRLFLPQTVDNDEPAREGIVLPLHCADRQRRVILQVAELRFVIVFAVRRSADYRAVGVQAVRRRIHAEGLDGSD